MYAWLPSIAVSELITVERDLFSAWHGDLLVASLRGQALFRLRRKEGRIVFAEPIPVGHHIRDLVELPDGRIVLLLDDRGLGVGVLEPVQLLESSDRPRDGAYLFGTCQGCHRIGDGSAHGIGPDLRAIFGRQIAGAPGYAYSPALRSLSGRWTEERLDRFLANPREFAPGTAMQFEGVPDATDRLFLIAYLRANR